MVGDLTVNAALEAPALLKGHSCKVIDRSSGFASMRDQMTGMMPYMRIMSIRSKQKKTSDEMERDLQPFGSSKRSTNHHGLRREKARIDFRLALALYV